MSTSLVREVTNAGVNPGGFPGGLKLNLGCGPVQPSGWINIDGSNRAFLSSKLNWLDNLLVHFHLIPPSDYGPKTFWANLLHGIPFPDNSVACIYAGELWEHFEHPQSYALTRECYRVLKPEGVLRICVPDGPTFWGRYLEIYNEEMAKPHSEQQAKALIAHTQMFFNDICTRRTLLRFMGHKHKWNFDEVQLREMFERSGFSQIERMHFRDSRIPDVDRVEHAVDFLIMEGVKQPVSPIVVPAQRRFVEVPACDASVEEDRELVEVAR